MTEQVGRNHAFLRLIDFNDPYVVHKRLYSGHMSLEAEGHLHRDEDSDDSEDDPFSIQVQSSMNPAITVNQ